MNSNACPIQDTCYLSFSCQPSSRSDQNHLVIGHEHLTKGDQIWYNHEWDHHSNYLYVILSGVLVCNRYSIYGDMNSYLLMGKGQTIGEMCLFTNNKAPFVMTALTEVELCKINSTHIEQLTLEKPELSKCIFNAIINNTIAILDFTDMLEMKSAYDRVRGVLVMFLRRLGEKNVSMKIDLTQKELANLTSSNRITVTRILKKMQKEGLVRKGNRHIWVDRNLVN